MKNNVIELVGYSGKPIAIITSHIMAITPHDELDDKTTIWMSTGDGSEEWIVSESYNVVRNKIEYALEEI